MNRKQTPSNETTELIWTENKIERLWGYYSKNLDPIWYFSYRHGEDILNRLSMYKDIRELDDILDFGCGPGFLIDHLLKSLHGTKARCYGVDFSKASIEMVEQKFKGRSNFESSQWIRQLPLEYKDGSMDLIISIEVVEHLDNQQLTDMLKEVYRLLRPNGHILVTTPHKEDLSKAKMYCPECNQTFHQWQHIRTWTIQKIVGEMESAGFETINAAATTWKAFDESPLIRVARKIRAFIKDRWRRPPEPHLFYLGKKS